jgi:hypothetical protein
VREFSTSAEITNIETARNPDRRFPCPTGLHFRTWNGTGIAR